MQLSVIIITYNSEKYIEECIKSLLNALNNFDDYEVIVIDNNSQDKTINILNNFTSSNIRVVEQSKNKGYSFSINAAVENVKFEAILILNPDIIIQKNAITELYSSLSLKNVGVAGPKLLNPDGSFQLSSRRHFPTLGIFFSYFLRLNRIFPRSQFFGKYNYTYLDEDLECEVDSISGACMMFSKNIYNAVDGFDETFFIYFEDTDFCIKAQSKGYKVLYCPKASLIHYNDYSDNQSIKSIGFYESLEKFIYKYKNKIYLGLLIYYLAKLIKYFFYLKRRFAMVK